MLGTYRPKSDPAVPKQVSRTTRTRPTSQFTGENGPKTRSASTRRAQEQPIAITYLGRSRTASDSEAAAGTSRSRRPSPSVLARKVERMTVFETKTDDPSFSSTSSTDSSSMSNKSQWTACIDTVNEIGTVAKSENKYIRRLKTMMSRRFPNFEKEVAKDERLTLVAIRFASNRHCWSLNSCHAYLPTIVENLISVNAVYQSIALNGLEEIADTWFEKICRFASAGATRIGVDIAAEERTDKARTCVEHFREIVKKRDSYYKRMDENAIYKLDNILAKLKTA